MSTLDIEVQNDTVSKIRILSAEKKGSNRLIENKSVSNFTRIKRPNSKNKVNLCETRVMILQDRGLTLWDRGSQTIARSLKEVFRRQKRNHGRLVLRKLVRTVGKKLS